MTRLEHLLEDTYRALRRADFAAVAAMAPEMERALAAFTGTADRVLVLRLQAMGQRNERLLEAARKGMRAARRRMEDVRRASQGIQTYDGTGRRADIAPAGRTAGRF